MTSSGKVTWKDIWPLPLESDKCGYAWAANGDMALTMDFHGSKYKLLPTFVKIINGEIDADPSAAGTWSADGCDIFLNGEYMMCARGWGLMTGAMKLSGNKAAEIQDEFTAYVIKRLNGADVK